MNFFESVILGAVEGITEFLPISSTGHLILASSLLGIPQSEFLKTFEIVIQLGAILAVVVLYWRAFLNIEILKRIIVAFIPTGLIGLALYPLIKSYLLGSEAVVLSALLLGGVALILFEWWHREHEEAHEDIATIPYKTAAYLGLFQAIAVVPGVSRSAATILGGLWLGLKRTAIVEFSFLLAVPTMLAASGYDLFKSAGSFSSADFSVLAVGFVVSFLMGLAAIRWLISYVRRHSFSAFGVYRIVLALLFFFFIVR